MNQQDLNDLTEYWHRETNYLNVKIDEAMKSAQDDAYARGYRRGREDLIEIRKQRDELLAALVELNSVSARGFLYGDPARVKARAAIASVKGGAA